MYSRMFHPGLSGCVGKRRRPKSTCEEVRSAKGRRSRHPVSGHPTSLAHWGHHSQSSLIHSSGKQFPQEPETRAASSPTASLLPLKLYQVARLCCYPGTIHSYRGEIWGADEGALPLSKRAGPRTEGLRLEPAGRGSGSISTHSIFTQSTHTATHNTHTHITCLQHIRYTTTPTHTRTRARGHTNTHTPLQCVCALCPGL